MMNTNTRTNAIVLLAIARVDPKNALLPKAVKWLMNARILDKQFVHWETTQETAWSAMALAEWMVSTGELASNYSYQVTLDNKLVGEGKVDTDNLDETRTLRVPIQETLGSLESELIISRSSPQGTLYYSAYLRRYIAAENIPPVSHGIVVQRNYLAVDPLTLNATSKEVNQVKVGGYVQVKLTVSVLNNINYLAVEDMLPAGFEVVDTSLSTSRTK